MKFTVTKTSLEEIQLFRHLFLHENKFQFVHNKCHNYNWADTYLFTADEIKIGYGSVWGKDKREDRDTIFEFYLTEPFKKFASTFFPKFIAAQMLHTSNVRVTICYYQLCCMNMQETLMQKQYFLKIITQLI